MRLDVTRYDPAASEPKWQAAWDAGGVFTAGMLFTALGGNYATVGAICAFVYALGLVVVMWYPSPPSEPRAVAP